MANCCANSFYSETLDAPDCSVACLSTATPGAVFVGASGDIYILIGSDPCVLSNWDLQSACCISFNNLSEQIAVCCNEELILTSSDGSVNIDIGVGGIDFTANTTLTFADDYTNTFNSSHGDIITFSDQNGVVVEIIADGAFMVSGNAYAGAGVPGITPTHATMTNYYFDTTNNVLYVWKPSTTSWIRINYLPSPVAMFSYIKGGLTATFNGNGSTSTQNGTTLTYQWTASGPGTTTFATPTAATTTATFTAPGSYTITLTVTDSNGATKAYTEIIDVEPKDKCDVTFEIPGSAFADTSNPLDSEVETWITANGPFNNHTLLYYIGTGSATSPQYVWYYTC